MSIFGRKKAEMEELETLKGEIKRKKSYDYESELKHAESRLRAVQDMISEINSPEALRDMGYGNQTKVQVLAILEDEAISLRKQISILRAKDKAREKLENNEYSSYQQKPVLVTAQSEIERAVDVAQSSRERLIDRSKERGAFHRRESRKKITRFLSNTNARDYNSSSGVKSYKQLAAAARDASSKFGIKQL